MSTIVLPTIIQGPAVVEHNGKFIYVQKDVSVKEATETLEIASAYGGRGKRFKSRTVKIGFTPVGDMISTADFNKLYPFGPTSIGKSIFGATPTVKIHSLTEGKVHCFSRGGISKYADLSLGPTHQPLGSMEITCIPKAASQPTAVDYWKAALATETFADTTFDDTKIFTDIYNAALGARSAPFNAMGSMDGFKVTPELKVKPIPAGDIGIADIIVDDLDCSVEFAPSNLSDDNIDTLLALQGTGALVPGQAFGAANEDLVIDSDSFSATIYRAGASESDRTFEKGEHRMKALKFVTQRYGNIPTASPLWLFTVS